MITSISEVVFWSWVAPMARVDLTCSVVFNDVLSFQFVPGNMRICLTREYHKSDCVTESYSP